MHSVFACMKRQLHNSHEKTQTGVSLPQTLSQMREPHNWAYGTKNRQPSLCHHSILELCAAMS